MPVIQRLMGGTGRNWLVDSDVPETVDGDYVLVSAEHIRAQEPFIYTGLCFGVPCALIIGTGNPDYLHYGLSLVIFLCCVAGMILRGPMPTTHGGAIRSLSISTAIIGFIVALGAAWAILSWRHMPPGEGRLAFPFFMMLGTLVIGYAFAMVRKLAAVLLAIGILPVAIALMLYGTVIEKTCAAGMIFAGGFMFLMARNSRSFLVELLLNRRRLHDLTRLDSLTQMPNRRALLEDAERMGYAVDSLRLILIDIDRFKAINDTHGHDMGDRVLCCTADAIGVFAGPGVSVARIGGEEFALVGSPDNLPASVAERLLEKLRDTAMPHGQRLTASVGIATGPMKTGEDWSLLYAAADRALYTAKDRGRDCAVSADGR